MRSRGRGPGARPARRAPPAGKRALLAAAAATVAADREATAEESELLRAIADALGCPLPPLALRAA
ncbi:MAG: hypothetical protein M5U13_12150 [Thermoanaerobaculia bacterium]|nr:hypothetical protein [Thermoanaerobaculia bacterium]